jgi:hypothetical protein
MSFERGRTVRHFEDAGSVHEADLQAEKRRGDPEADDDALERGRLRTMGARAPLASTRAFTWSSFSNMTNRAG